MMMSMETRAWYLDKFGVERECIVFRVSGTVDGIIGVVDLMGNPLDVDREDLYYVPQHADPE